MDDADPPGFTSVPSTFMAEGIVKAVQSVEVTVSESALNKLPSG